jgi:hypothetical protein
MATKNQEVQQVTIAPMDLRKVSLTLVGDSPIVTHPFPLKALRQIEDKQHGAAKTKKHELRNEWEDFIESLYWLSEPPGEYSEEAWEAVKGAARFGVHVGGIKSSATSAAYRSGTVKNIVSANGMFRITNTEQDRLYRIDCCELTAPKPPTMRKDCLSTFSSGADMRYRPQFDEWKITLDVMYNAGLISIDALFTWFSMGGFSCGLGEYRAEKGGTWGSYHVQAG